MVKYNCIICNRPAAGGVLGNIGELTVSLCKDHVGMCSQECDGCAHSNACSIKARL